MKKLWIAAIALMLPLSTAAHGLFEHKLKLDNSHSTLTFVSVKKGSIGEVHRFTQLSGELEKGEARIEINLASVETGIPVRNQRMQQMLFDVASFPQAIISADFDAELAELKPGEVRDTQITFGLDLHGIQKALKADVTVIGIDGGIMVVSRAPVIVSATDFDLGKGIEALREIAKLSSIAQAVPVSFQLAFRE